jgi:hypothetical protein
MKRPLILLFLFILTICFSSCGLTKETSKYNKSKNTCAFDTSVVVILPFDTIQYWVFKGCKPSDLSNNDLKKIKTILDKCISDYNSGQEKQFKELNEKHSEYKLNKQNFIIDLTGYKRQYVGVLNTKGEKEVWVNCFCETRNQDWKKNIIFVKDGGNCYFNLKINLTTDKYYELIVNGDA